MSTQSAIREAEAEIMRILAKLEKETGSLVESVEIADIDVSTTVESMGVRTAIIRMHRLPGANWAA